MKLPSMSIPTVPGLPGFSPSTALRVAQFLLAFGVMVAVAIVISDTRSWGFTFGEDVYTLILSLVEMVFAGVCFFGLLPLEGSRITALTHTSLEILMNVLWFAAFIASCVAHASCSGSTGKDHGDKKSGPDFCSVGKAVIILSVIMWLLHLGTSAIIGKSVWDVMRFDGKRANASDAEHLAAYQPTSGGTNSFENFQNSSRGPPPYPLDNSHYPSAHRDDDQESWMTRESFDSKY